MSYRSVTVTTEGTLVPGISRHFIRINPVEIGNRSRMRIPIEVS